MKTFEEDFKDDLLFIQRYEAVINSHLVDFITEDLWEKSMPNDLRIELEEFVGESNFSHLMNHCPKLKSIIEATELLNLKNNSKVLKLEDLQINSLSNDSNWKVNGSLKVPQNDFMKDKKRYEISVLSRVVGSLAEDNQCLVIDAGGGKGYLGTYLSEKYSIPVLSIDSNPGRNKSAIDRQKLMEKKKHQSFPLTQHSIEFIDDNTNYSELVKSNFPNWKGNDYFLTGLHTCGPLAHAMIKSFVNSETIKILCVVSCCYHLTDEFLTTKIHFSKTMRMLAQQSVERISAKNCQQPTSIFYRPLLQVLFKSLGVSDARVGRGAPTENFQTYAKWGLTKIQLPAHKIPTENDLTNLQKKYSSYQWKLNIFQTLRAHMGSIIESSIILDRLIYLQRSRKCSKLSIVRLFDPLLSPRCYAIIALK